MLEYSNLVNPYVDAELRAAAQHRADMALVELKSRFDKIKSMQLLQIEAEKDSVVDKVNRFSMGIYQSQMKNLYEFASDNLETIFSLLGKETGLMTYVLNRATIESISVALWLASFDSVEKRAFHAIDLTYCNYTNSKDAFREVAESDKSIEEIQNLALALLHDCKNEMKAYRTKSFSKAINRSQAVQKVDSIYRKQIGARHLYSGLTVWKICSGITHASESAIGNMTVYTSKENNDELKKKTQLLKPKSSSLALVLYPTIENLELFAHVYRQQCRRS